MPRTKPYRRQHDDDKLHGGTIVRVVYKGRPAVFACPFAGVTELSGQATKAITMPGGTVSVAIFSGKQTASMNAGAHLVSMADSVVCEVVIIARGQIEPRLRQIATVPRRPLRVGERALHRQRIRSLRLRMGLALRRRWRLPEPLERERGELGERALIVALHRKLDSQSSDMKRAVERKLAHSRHRIASAHARLEQLASEWWRWAGNRVLSDWQDATPCVHFSPYLDDDDRRLVGKWKKPDSEDPESWDKLVYSARRAEKSASMYFQQLRHDVKDVTIHQLTGASKSWTTHDLVVDQRPIDVKNVRGGSFGGFVVPNQPKKTEHGVNVTVFGVVSEGEGERRQTVVGESSGDRLTALAQAVEDFAQKMDLPLTWANVARWQRGLGAWLMEYPPRHYDQWRYQIATLRRAEDLFGSAPSWMRGLTSFRCGSSKSYGDDYDVTARELAAWHAPDRRSRPALFIFVMLYFLAAARRGSWKPDRTREELLDLLFVRRVRSRVTFQYPVGLHDPMKIVYAVVRSLDELISRNKDILADLEALHLTGLGILRGRRRGRKWFTLLAYCGGCGKSPIWAGHLKTLWRSEWNAGDGTGECGLCHKCLRLVCDSCGFCKEDCENLQLRHLDQAP